MTSLIAEGVGTNTPDIIRSSSRATWTLTKPRSPPGDRTLAIRVEPSESSKAKYHLESQLDIDTFLQTLLEFRRGGTNPD